MSVFKFRYAHATLLLFLCFGNLSAQLNPDTAYIRNKKIKSATFQYTTESRGIVFYYDQRGRITKTVDFEWYKDENYGDCFVSYYDSVGRNIGHRNYQSRDSLRIKNPSEQDQLLSVTYWEQYGDTLEIRIDSAWDNFHRLLEVRHEQTVSEWSNPSPAPKFASVYYPRGELISSQLRTRSTYLFYYATDTSLSPYFVNYMAGVTMSSAKISNDKLYSTSFGETYVGDTVMRYLQENYYTLHGTHDTLCSSYKIIVTHINDTSNIRFKKVEPYYQYVESKWRFGKYHVKYNDNSGLRRWTKFRSKTPWEESPFGNYSSQRPGKMIYSDDFFTIAFIRKDLRIEPVCNYW